MHELLTGINDVTCRAIRRHCGGGGKGSVVVEKRKRKVRQAARKRTTGQVLRDIERCVNHVAGTLPVAIIVAYDNTGRVRTDCIVVSYDSTSQQKKKKLYWP